MTTTLENIDPGITVRVRITKASGGGHDYSVTRGPDLLAMGWSGGTRREAMKSALDSARERLSRKAVSP